MNEYILKSHGLMRDNVQKYLFADVDIRLPPYSKRYPELANLGIKADINSIWRNVFAGSEQVLFKKPKGTDDWDNQVFAAQPDLKAVSAETPFRPLPLSEIGLYEDPRRAKE